MHVHIFTICFLFCTFIKNTPFLSVWKTNDSCLARYGDGRFYPSKIIAVRGNEALIHYNGYIFISHFFPFLL